MESLKLVKTLALLQMTLDTYGLPEDKYLAIFKEKAEFACKALLTVQRVVDSYQFRSVKLDSKLFWDLYQEIGYATDDACRVKQKKEDPQALEERSYTTSTYPTTGAVFTEVEKLKIQVDNILKLMSTMAEYMLDTKG
jgi:hypothetical protein